MALPFDIRAETPRYGGTFGIDMAGFIQANFAYLFANIGPGAGVSTFNTRSGDVTLVYNDVFTALGYAPASYASPAFTGTPTAPTAAPGTNTVQLASTAFVTAAVAAGAGGGVTAVVGIGSPAFSFCDTSWGGGGNIFNASTEVSAGFTITGSKQFAFQTYVQRGSCGVASNISGTPEVYSTVIIEKVA